MTRWHISSVQRHARDGHRGAGVRVAASAADGAATQRGRCEARAGASSGPGCAGAPRQSAAGGAASQGERARGTHHSRAGPHRGPGRGLPRRQAARRRPLPRGVVIPRVQKLSPSIM